MQNYLKVHLIYIEIKLLKMQKAFFELKVYAYCCMYKLFFDDTFKKKY